MKPFYVQKDLLIEQFFEIGHLFITYCCQAGLTRLLKSAQEFYSSPVLLSLTIFLGTPQYCELDTLT